MHTFDEYSYPELCQKLSELFPEVANIVRDFGNPPMFQRVLNFESLVQIILEQQVSLASANAALIKLKSKLETITPEQLLKLDVTALRTCSVSRQKAGYLFHLAETVSSGQLDFRKFNQLSNQEVRATLMTVKGIGSWTADIVLMLCMQRADVFPLGDVALINSIKYLHVKPEWAINDIELYAHKYAPYRTIAAYFYWHAYIGRKNIKSY